jgi:hypothetical protein
MRSDRSWSLTNRVHWSFAPKYGRDHHEFIPAQHGIQLNGLAPNLTASSNAIKVFSGRLLKLQIAKITGYSS